MVLQTFVPYCVFFFVCVCMCMSQTQNKRKLQAGEVMCETRLMRICVLKERREKERNMKNKSEKTKKKCSKGFQYTKSISQFTKGFLHSEVTQPSNVMD